MSNFTDKVRGLTSRRVQQLPEPDAPTPFQTGMGWGPAGDTRLDPPSEGEARRSGAAAMAALHAEQTAGRREAMERRLAGVQRGIDYDAMYRS